MTVSRAAACAAIVLAILSRGETRSLAQTPPESPAPIAAVEIPLSKSSAPGSQGPVIRDIEFRGLKTVDERQALRALPFREGEPLPRLAPGRLIQDLYATGLFQPDIRIAEESVPGESGAIRLIITVIENPIIEEITVSGSERIKDRSLLRKIHNKGFKPNKMLTSKGLEEIRSVVLKEYHSRGYAEALVTVNSEPGAVDATKVAIRVVIVEGKRRILRDLTLKGNEHISGLMLRLIMDNRGSWGPFTSYYDAEAMKGDIEAIRIFYVNRGYLDADVKAGEPQTGGEGRKAWISPVIEITEGPRYRVGEIKAQGVSVFTELEVVAPFDKSRGRYYSGARTRDALEKVTRLYGDAGYVNAEIDPDFDLHPDTGQVNLILKVTEHSQIYVGRILVKRGDIDNGDDAPWWERLYSGVAPPIKEQAILREVELQSGDVYRSYRELNSKRRLENLGVFEKVTIRREPTADPTVNDAVIDVQDANDTGRIAVGLGYGDATRGFVYLSYTERNLFGEARDLRASVTLGEEAWGSTIGYLDRHLDDTDFSLGVDLFYENYQRVEYSERLAGGAVTLGHPLGDRDRYNIRVKTYHVDLDSDDDEEQTEEDLDKSYVVATVRPSITFDRRDDPGFATRGYEATFAVEGGYGDGGIAKFETDVEHFTPLPAEFVWAKHLRFGIMPTDAEDVGITERYFLGGSDSLRGFRFRGAGPKDAKDDDIPIGGASTLLLQNELRYPIAKQLSVLTFFDLGLIGEEPLDYDSPRTSAGIGGRYNTRPVTIAVDLGWAIEKDEDDDTEMFHLRLGSRF
mgnify:CR=1 FL=1